MPLQKVVDSNVAKQLPRLSGKTKEEFADFLAKSAAKIDYLQRGGVEVSALTRSLQDIAVLLFNEQSLQSMDLRNASEATAEIFIDVVLPLMDALATLKAREVVAGKLIEASKKTIEALVLQARKADEVMNTQERLIERQERLLEAFQADIKGLRERNERQSTLILEQDNRLRAVKVATEHRAVG